MESTAETEVEAGAIAQVYSLNYKNYSEDRYSEWNELRFSPDGTCSYFVVQAGVGRCGSEPSKHEKLQKSGTWSDNHNKTGAVVTWTDGKTENFSWEKLRRG
mmetsp:Transcript_46622/g.85415  ORF Transcript_46622/g.85415 Transcript_46622/m.85415 type:complete len:102 (+) Transcript_46622:42-347(+)